MAMAMAMAMAPSLSITANRRRPSLLPPAPSPSPSPSPPGRRGLLQAPHVLLPRTKKSRVIQNMASSKSKEVNMVDPNEAKRLAVEQMQQLQAKALYKRQQAVEAFNGGWAVLGLTAGLVIEGYTGKSILYQIAVYLHLLADALDVYFP